jgi:hypothetical protein
MWLFYLLFCLLLLNVLSLLCKWLCICLALVQGATNTNFIIFGLIWPGLQSTLYRTRGENANHYATDAVVCYLEVSFIDSNLLYRRVIMTCLTVLLVKLIHPKQDLYFQYSNNLIIYTCISFDWSLFTMSLLYIYVIYIYILAHK